VAVAFALEYAQHLIPSRDPRLTDAVIKALGGLAGAGAGAACNQLCAFIFRSWCRHKWRESESRAGSKVCVRCHARVAYCAEVGLDKRRAAQTLPTYGMGNVAQFPGRLRKYGAGRQQPVTEQERVAIVVELHDGGRVKISAGASPDLAAATLRELQRPVHEAYDARLDAQLNLSENLVSMVSE
jgi:hypothetical protein